MMEETRDGREVERCGPDEVFGGRIVRRCLLSSVLRVFHCSTTEYSVYIVYLLQVKCRVYLLKGLTVVLLTGLLTGPNDWVLFWRDDWVVESVRYLSDLLR